MRLFHPALAMALIIASPTPALAQENPFDAVSSLVEWFDRLNTSWDRIVTREERAQYLRSLDRLRRELLDLEGGTELLLAEIPDHPPDAEERVQLEQHIDELLASVTRVRGRADEVESEIALADPSLPREISQTAAGRTAALRFLQRELNESDFSWSPQEIRSRLGAALRLVSQTQIAVTRFRNRIASQRQRN